MNKKDLLFTFDYELFLGKKSGSVENCMIKPTKKVVSILNQYKIKGIFFVDCSYLNRLEEVITSHPQAMSDYNKIKVQLLQLIEQGHYIYPHVHPHWIDAIYNSEYNNWNLTNNSKYRMNSLSKEKRDEHFNSALLSLKKITNSTCSFDAYRAGGWCIQPFNIFKSLFESNKVYSDFSVLGGSKKEGNTLSFDFRTIKPNSTPYRFDSAVDKQSKNGYYKEYPISSIKLKKNSLPNKLINKALWRLPYGKNMGDGISSPFKSSINPIDYDSSFEMISIELLNINKLNRYKSFLKRNDYMQFISHPKMISQHNLDVLSKFLKYASKKHTINSDWKKIELNNN